MAFIKVKDLHIMANRVSVELDSKPKNPNIYNQSFIRFLGAQLLGFTFKSYDGVEILDKQYTIIPCIEVGLACDYPQDSVLMERLIQKIKQCYHFQLDPREKKKREPAIWFTYDDYRIVEEKITFIYHNKNLNAVLDNLDKLVNEYYHLLFEVEANNREYESLYEWGLSRADALFKGEK